MGKKSSSSSAPAIPEGMVEALQTQANVAQQQQEWYENVVYPWYKQETEEANDLQEKLANASMEDAEWWRTWTAEQSDKSNAIRDEYYSHWKNDYLPIEQELIKDAEEYNTDAYAEKQAQSAIGDMASAYANQRQQTAINLSKYGIDPTSGQYVGQMNALGVNQAAATAAAANAARQAAVELGWEKNLALANLGLQYAGITNNATSALNQTASTGAASTTNAQNSASNASSQQLSNISGFAQTGLNSYQTLSNAWGNIASGYNNMYNSQLSAWQTQQQINSSSASGFGSLLGTGITAAATAY